MQHCHWLANNDSILLVLLLVRHQQVKFPLDDKYLFEGKVLRYNNIQLFLLSIQKLTHGMTSTACTNDPFEKNQWGVEPQLHPMCIIPIVLSIPEIHSVGYIPLKWKHWWWCDQDSRCFTELFLLICDGAPLTTEPFMEGVLTTPLAHCLTPKPATAQNFCSNSRRRRRLTSKPLLMN